MGLEFRQIVRLFLLLLAGGLSSCSREPTTGDVSGTLTLASKAPNLDGLQINFMSERGGMPIAATVNLDGTFTATGVPAGKILIGLNYVSKEPDPSKAPLGPIRKKGAKDGKGSKEAYLKALNEHLTVENPIPAAFRDPRTSGKTMVIEAGKQNTLIWNISP